MEPLNYLYHICRKEDEGNLRKGYIGITKNLDRRWRQHNKPSSRSHVSNAIRKYNDIIFTGITEGSREEMARFEEYLRPRKDIGWNIDCGGRIAPDRTGHIISQETRKKMSNSHIGRKVSQETRNKISKAQKGIPRGKNPKISKALRKEDNYWATVATKRSVFKRSCSRSGESFNDYLETFMGRDKHGHALYKYTR